MSEVQINDDKKDDTVIGAGHIGGVIRTDQCVYKQYENNLPYPRTSWITDCGLDYTLLEGYNKDWQSMDYGKLLKPQGKCMKCKREIVAL